MKLLVSLLTTLLVTLTAPKALAEPPIIWGSNQTARLLEHNLNFNQTVYALTGPETPSATAFNAPKGSLFLSTNGTVYSKQDAGSSTNWSPLLSSTTGWAVAGNAGTTFTSNYVGTSDSQGLSIRTNATEAIRIDYAQNLGFNTAPSARFHFKFPTNSDMLYLEGPGSGTYHTWEWSATNAGGLWLKNLDNTSFFHTYYNGSDGHTGFGISPDYKLHVSKANTNTTPTGLNNNVPMVVVQNSSATVNNWEGLAFQNSGSLGIIGLIAGINEDHNGAGSQTGHISMYTTSGGTTTEALRLLSDASVQIPSGVLDMNSHRINNVTDPSAAQDAATKAYVDGKFPVSVPNGGTGNTTLTLNGVLYGNGTSSLLTTTAGTVNQILTANASGVPQFGAVTLSSSAAVTGTLPVANGGTGVNLLTANYVVLGNGTNPVIGVAPSTSGNVLTSNGSTWVSSPPAATGGNLNARFVMQGAVIPMTDIDGPHYQAGTQSLTTVNLAMLNSGNSGSTTVQLNQYRSGALLNSATASISAASGNPASSAAALSGILSLAAGDIVTVDVIGVPGSGAPESLSVEY